MVTKDELRHIVAELNRKLSEELIDGSPDVVIIEEKPLDNMLNQDVFWFMNNKVVVNQDALNDMYPYLNQFETEKCLYDHIREGLARRGRLKG